MISVIISKHIVWKFFGGSVFSVCIFSGIRKYYSFIKPEGLISWKIQGNFLWKLQKILIPSIVVGLDDLESLLQPKWFYDFTSLPPWWKKKSSSEHCEMCILLYLNKLSLKYLPFYFFNILFKWSHCIHD